MPQVEITVNSRLYVVTCGEGQEGQILRLGRYLDQKVGELVKANGQVGDARLAVMAGLLIADELVETNQALAQLRSETAAGTRRDPVPPSALRGPADEELLAEAINALAERIEIVAQVLEHG